MSRLATTSFALALAATGCLAADGAGDEGIYIEKMVASPDSCSFTSTEGEPFIGQGFIVAGAPAAYVGHPQLKSRITAPGDQVVQRTIQIRGSRVSLEFTNDEIGDSVDPVHKQFQSLFSGPLAPNGGITDISAELIPEGALAALAGITADAQVIAKIVTFGDLAGDEVTSQEYRFPITICTNCITNRLVDTANVPLQCPVSAEIAVRNGNACNPFQDGIVDCCTNPGGSLTCPATVAQN